MASRIAEGCGRDTDAEFAADLKRVATMSSEVEYPLLLAKDLGYFTQDAQESLTTRLVEVRKMTFGLLRSL